MPFKVIIIDDEKLGREIIKKYLSSFPQFTLAAECSNGFEGIKQINEHHPDLIFLDIQMPKITGFEMLELLEKPPFIIFTTAYDQYAIKAFEVNAIDYLLKPFSLERFNEAVNKALEKISGKENAAPEINKLIIHNAGNINYLERIIIKDGPEVSIVPVDSILFIEAQDDYVMIHTQDKKYIKQQTMKYLEEHLNPEDFIRIHRSFITAVAQITKIELLEKETYQIRLKNNKSLPVSKSGYDKLKKILHS